MREVGFIPLGAHTLHLIGVTEPLAGKFAPALSQTMGQYDIVGPAEQAHFLGQVLTESGRLRYTEEIWGPTQAQSRYDIRQDLGNTPASDGDGEKYRGRGLIQVTGKANYERFGKHLRRQHGIRKDLLRDPSPVAEQPYSCICAGWYWSSHDLSAVAQAGVDADTCRKVTEVVNGGHNHLKRRTELTQKAHEELLGAESLPNADKVPVFAPETADKGVEVPHKPIEPPTDGV